MPYTISFSSFPDLSNREVNFFHEKLLETRIIEFPSLMEFDSSSLSIVLAFLFFIIAVLKIRKRPTSTANLPPGPWRIPILGNMHQMVGSITHRKLRDLANKYGPLMHLKLGEVIVIVVSSAEMAKEVMKTHDLVFSTRPDVPSWRIMLYENRGISVAPYGDYWRQTKKICTLELLNAKRVQSFQPVREEEMTNFIEWINSNSGSSVNLSKKLMSTSYGITSRTAFGKKSLEQDMFIKVISEFIEFAAGFSIADLFPSVSLLHVISGIRHKLENLHREADGILEKIIEEHRRKEADEEDLVDVLLKFENADNSDFSLHTTDIKAVILDIFAAGSETSSTTVIWAMAEMIRNPSILAKAQTEVRQLFQETGIVEESRLSELKYIKLVIKEILRCHPPVPLLIPRECRENCSINGHTIPAKARIIVNAWAIGRDPKYWSEPEKFEPERFLDSNIDYRGNNLEYIPFGAGRRMCPGILLGMANVEYELAMLLFHFDWKLPDGMKNEDLDMSEAFGITVRRKDELYLIPTRYYPSQAQ